MRRLIRAVASNDRASGIPFQRNSEKEDTSSAPRQEPEQSAADHDGIGFELIFWILCRGFLLDHPRLWQGTAPLPGLPSVCRGFSAPTSSDSDRNSCMMSLSPMTRMEHTAGQKTGSAGNGSPKNHTEMTTALRQPGKSFSILAGLSRGDNDPARIPKNRERAAVLSNAPGGVRATLKSGQGFHK